MISVVVVTSLVRLSLTASVAQNLPGQHDSSIMADDLWLPAAGLLPSEATGQQGVMSLLQLLLTTEPDHLLGHIILHTLNNDRTSELQKAMSRQKLRFTHAVVQVGTSPASAQPPTA